jgi:hypothetical protein
MYHGRRLNNFAIILTGFNFIHSHLYHLHFHIIISTVLGGGYGGATAASPASVVVIYSKM